MSDQFNIYKQAKLIFKKNFSSLSDMEEDSLNAWLEQDDSNSDLLKELSDEKTIPTYLNNISSYDKKSAFEKFEASVDKERAYEKHIDRKSASLFIKISRYAAIFIVPFLLGVLAYNIVSDISFEDSKELASETVIPPGNSKALLQMADGSKVVLTGRSKSDLLEKDGTVIKTDSTQLDYSKSGNTNARAKDYSKLAMNTLSVPRQGEYKLVLEDGTTVWLNSDTKLSYPSHFGKNKRYVELEGEAYFDVAKDKKRPFIVKSGETEVKVLGTEFNINAYSDNEDIKTTLVEGSVAFSQSIGKTKKDVVLKPGQQAVVNKGLEGIDVKKVNTSIYTAWKEGRFVFEDESFDNIMKILSRWYDVEVFFQNNSLKDLRFSGDLKRFENINSHLEMLGMTTNVSFSIKGNVVWVREKY